MMTRGQSKIQVIWGFALVLAGIGVFIRVPQVMPRVESIVHFAQAGWMIRFCFYLIGVLLIGGGLRKLHTHIPRKRQPEAEP
jgi:steroid 5-alpha reductase family enzyme